jgi:hypothetical protein
MAGAMAIFWRMSALAASIKYAPARIGPVPCESFFHFTGVLPSRIIKTLRARRKMAMGPADAILDAVIRVVK